MTEWLDARSPDVVCLQETKVEDDKFPEEAIREAGYEPIAFGQKTYNGVAVLVRHGSGPVRPIDRGLPGQDAMGARLVSCDVGGTSVVSVYVPNGKTIEHPDYERKLAWLDALRAHLSEAFDPTAPLVVAGDFNICPTDLDTHDPQRLAGTIFHTDRERAAFRALLDVGIEDPYRRLEPEGRAFTWWDYRGGSFHKNHGLRIDFVLLSGVLAEQTRRVWVDRDYRKKSTSGDAPSDHAPVLVELSA